MYALSLSQPWAWCVVHGPKRIENRSSQGLATHARTLVGQPIMIHAAKSWDAVGAQMIRSEGLAMPMQVGLPAGAVIGVATITNIFPFDRGIGVYDAGDYRLPDDQKIWTFGPWCFALEDVRPIAKPVPTRGMPMFWIPPHDVEREVVKQIDAAEVAGG
jgi:hypothetical protein